MVDIKYIIRRTTIVLITMSLMLITYAGYIVLFPSNTFHSSYQSVIQDKFDNLINETDPKIIIIGGSSAGLGINEDLLSEKTGYPVVNLGLHAGFGCLFNTEIAKANIREGDIILLGYEYNWWEDGNFDTLGVDLVMSGIDNKVEMYCYIPIRNWVELIGYLPKYYETKVSYTSATGTYSRSSFDEKGQMVLRRDFELSDYSEEIYNYVDLSNAVISEESIEYLKRFKRYVENRNASVYFIPPPLYEKAKRSDDESFLSFAKQEEEKIGIPYISNPLDYIYPEEYIFDTIYHCSSIGAIKRTEQLALDLKEHHVIL